MENIITFIKDIGLLVSAITALYVSFKNAKKEIIPKKVKNQSNIHLEITNLMEVIKELSKADRVQIYDFHNGVTLANGVSLLKCSCTSEVVRIGTKAYFKDLQNIHLGMIPHFTNELLNKKEIVINDIEEIKEKMPATYEFKKSQNVGGFYDILLNDKQGEPIGFIGIQFNEANSINFNEEEKKELYRYKKLIEEYKEKMKDKE